MSMYLFSPSTKGFYDSSVNSTWPEDAVEVSSEERDAVIAAANTPGFRVEADAHGRPVAREATLTDEEKLEALRRVRNALLKSSDITQLPDYPISDEKRAEWTAYRQELRDAPDTPERALPTKPD